MRLLEQTTLSLQKRAIKEALVSHGHNYEPEGQLTLSGYGHL
jgi:hypothetical protein